MIKNFYIFIIVALCLSLTNMSIVMAADGIHLKTEPIASDRIPENFVTNGTHFIRPASNTMFLPPGNAWIINDDETGGDCDCIGSWDPDTNTCTLTTDISKTILIDSNDITLDGNGHTLFSNGAQYGVYSYEKEGLAIKNMKIINYSYGIIFEEVKNSTITHNSILNNEDSGILFSYLSNNNTISFNNFSNNNNIDFGLGADIFFELGCDNNTIIGNNFDNNTKSNSKGIFMWCSSKYNMILNNKLSDVTITLMDGSGENTIINNTISGGSILDSHANGGTRIINNTISGGGIFFEMTGGNTIINNTISNNEYGIEFFDGACCDTVIGNHISNTEYGILFNGGFLCCNNHQIINNTITNNDYGIYLSNANDNLIYQNNLINNKIYNAYEIFDDNFDWSENENPGNKWDNDYVGNHWGDFDETCEGCDDTNNNGICDSPYYIPGGSGMDNYPLVEPCGDWRDEWMGENSDGGTAVTTTELQSAIHHWLEDIPVKCHIIHLADLQEIIAVWLLE